MVELEPESRALKKTEMQLHFMLHRRITVKDRTNGITDKNTIPQTTCCPVYKKLKSLHQ